MFSLRRLNEVPSSCRGKAHPRDLNPETRRSRRPDLDLHDIIEAGRQLEWADGSGPVLSQAAASLLHHLRVTRNVSAHAGESEAENWREVALLAARYAASLWKNSKAGRRKMKPKTL